MNNDQLKTLIQQGLSAMKAGGKTAAEAADEIQNDASNDQLKSTLKKGVETSKQWQQRIGQALQEVGSQQQQQQDNDIVKAMYKVSKEIRQQAPNDRVRDLGIIANGQLALHYWIAAFGTMEAYCKQVGMDQAAQNMKSCVSEARQADEQHTKLAQQIMQKSEQTAGAM